LTKNSTIKQAFIFDEINDDYKIYCKITLFTI